MRSATLAAILLFSATHSFAQIDPNSVRQSDRDAWCQSQTSQCPLICTQTQEDDSASTAANDCDSETLVFNCICGDGIAPNVTEYTQTIPFYICTERNNQCVAGCGQNNECQRSCREDNPCAAKNPPQGTMTLSSTMATATATESSSPDSTDLQTTGLGGGPAPTDDPNAADPNAEDDPNAAQMTINLGQSYGLAVIFTGVFAGFALLL